MTKHTPGDWIIHPPDASGRWADYRVSTSTRAGIGMTIAFVCADLPQSEANVRLIAIAPLLLEALGYYVRLHEDHSNTMPERNENESKEWKRTLALAKAALALTNP